MLVLYLASPEGEPRKAPEPNLVLTRRCENLNKHAGQISLPGGRQDDGECLETTALRETFEEIGVAPEQVELLGQLNPVYIPPSDFTVTPFVGWLDHRTDFVPSDLEVAEIIEVPLQKLLRPETLVIGPVRTANGSVLNVPYYQIDRHQVWGATAIILAEFIERLEVAIGSRL